MRPTTCVVAAEEPEIAAKIEQPMTLTCSSRPGSSAAQGVRPRNSDCDRRVRNRISPMTMNSGSASSSCVVRMFQAYCARSLSSGMSLNTASSTVPVTASVQPIHRPPARKANSTTNMTRTMASIVPRRRRSLFGDRGRAHAKILQRQTKGGLAEARHELENEQADAEGHHRLRDPQRAFTGDRDLAGGIAAPGEVDHGHGQEAGEADAQPRQHGLQPAPHG